MNRSVCITISITATPEVLKNLVQKSANALKLQGTAHAVDKDSIKVMAYGSGDAIEQFIDMLYEGYKDHHPDLIEVEPFTKDQDYRGVFRIIEK